MFEGKWLWIWNVQNCDGGDLATIARRCQDAGIRGVLVKSDDGGSWFDQGRPWAEIAAALRASGLVVAAWGYHYLDNPAAEAARAIETIQSGVCDAYVSDLEAESEGKAQAAAQFFQRIRAAVGQAFPLAYSPLPVIDYHQALPYWQANQACQAVLPQFYTRDLGWSLQALWAQWDKWSTIWRTGGQTVPVICPVFDAYRPEFPGDAQAYQASIQARHVPGCSFWSYEHLATDEAWAAIKAFQVTPSALPEAFQPYGVDWHDAAENLKGIADEANRRRAQDYADAQQAITLLQRILQRNADTQQSS